ncbi:hypothetical protein GJ496_000587 [Pomphorhynchus laevis]|nr:hypothetical protein GJ496_000587 [Pomphorhynchus laevis]
MVDILYKINSGYSASLAVIDQFHSFENDRNSAGTMRAIAGGLVACSCSVNKLTEEIKFLTDLILKLAQSTELNNLFLYTMKMLQEFTQSQLESERYKVIYIVHKLVEIEEMKSYIINLNWIVDIVHFGLFDQAERIRRLTYQIASRLIKDNTYVEQAVIHAVSRQPVDMPFLSYVLCIINRKSKLLDFLFNQLFTLNVSLSTLKLLRYVPFNVLTEDQLHLIVKACEHVGICYNYGELWLNQSDSLIDMVNKFNLNKRRMNEMYNVAWFVTSIMPSKGLQNSLMANKIIHNANLLDRNSFDITHLLTWVAITRYDKIRRYKQIAFTNDDIDQFIRFAFCNTLGSLFPQYILELCTLCRQCAIVNDQVESNILSTMDHILLSENTDHPAITVWVRVCIQLLPNQWDTFAVRILRLVYHLVNMCISARENECGQNTEYTVCNSVSENEGNKNVDSSMHNCVREDNVNNDIESTGFNADNQDECDQDKLCPVYNSVNEDAVNQITICTNTIENIKDYPKTVLKCILILHESLSYCDIPIFSRQFEDLLKVMFKIGVVHSDSEIRAKACMLAGSMLTCTCSIDYINSICDILHTIIKLDEYKVQRAAVHAFTDDAICRQNMKSKYVLIEALRNNSNMSLQLDAALSICKFFKLNIITATLPLIIEVLVVFSKCDLSRSSILLGHALNEVFSENSRRLMLVSAITTTIKNHLQIKETPIKLLIFLNTCLTLLRLSLPNMTDKVQRLEMKILVLTLQYISDDTIRYVNIYPILAFWQSLSLKFADENELKTVVQHLDKLYHNPVVKKEHGDWLKAFYRRASNVATSNKMNLQIQIPTISTQIKNYECASLKISSFSSSDISVFPSSCKRSYTSSRSKKVYRKLPKLNNYGNVARTRSQGRRNISTTEQEDNMNHIITTNLQRTISNSTIEVESEDFMLPKVDSSTVSRDYTLASTSSIRNEGNDQWSSSEVCSSSFNSPYTRRSPLIFTSSNKSAYNANMMINKQEEWITELLDSDCSSSLIISESDDNLKSVHCTNTLPIQNCRHTASSDLYSSTFSFDTSMLRSTSYQDTVLCNEQSWERTTHRSLATINLK